MSSTAPIDIPEAELASDPNLNPFAAPTPIDRTTTISPGLGRASQEEIDTAVQSLIAAEFSYVALWIATIANYFLPQNEIAYWTWMACSVVSLICYGRMMSSCKCGGLLAGLMTLVYLVPAVGFFIYLAGKKMVIDFLTWNGYRPGLLGAIPDRAEIEAMNSNGLYRPSPYFRLNGSRRKKPWTLSDIFVGLVVLAGIGFVGLPFVV